MIIGTEASAVPNIDTSLNSNIQDFSLSDGIIGKLESGRLDRHLDIQETLGLYELLGRGEQQSMFQDPLAQGTGNLGGLQLGDRITGARDIEGLAGQHSAENYLGGAGSVDRYQGPGETNPPEWRVTGETTVEEIDGGWTKTTMVYVNKHDNNHEKSVTTYENKDGRVVINVHEDDRDESLNGLATVREHKHTLTQTRTDGAIRTTTETEVWIESEDAESYEFDSEVVDFDGSVTKERKEKINPVNAKRVEDPTNDNIVRPMTDRDDPMGIIGARDSLHERLRAVNPEIDPINEGDQSGYGDYINPVLVALGSSDGGRSTGVWEEVGGSYLGPNIDAVKDFIGGTSTGTDWF